MYKRQELWEQKLRLQAYAAIRQRIDMNIVLGRLDRAETGKYIAAHLAYSGAGKEIFTSGAEDEVYKISAGIPRMINRKSFFAFPPRFKYNKENIGGCIHVTYG